MLNEKIPNRLINETSPYLLQHANNPVDWYPWGEEAFAKARAEDKPVFLSIGYSTCHWCHVMAQESFEDNETADLLNKNFISVKVDKEERPDVDGVYMSVCQALTGSGGWPTSIFITPDQKPFFAGTYFPKHSKYGMLGFTELLSAVSEKWQNNRQGLVSSADEIVRHLNAGELKTPEVTDSSLPNRAYDGFSGIYDSRHGGFGNAPKFPTPHNLMFLMKYYEKYGEKHALYMAEHTLEQMYKGGIFDHIGGGFSRYSTDKYWLAPHFEKMLYDNALTLVALAEAYRITNKPIYKYAAEKTAEFVTREMTSDKGGFYSAQDADSGGVEGGYYLFDYDEIITVLGDSAGERFCSYFGITKEGNFEGKNIPNLLGRLNPSVGGEFDESLSKLCEYRKTRTKLHTDDKILTAWNSLMVAAFAALYRIFGGDGYLERAVKAADFIEENLREGDSLYVGIREEKRSNAGFLDDYAFYAMASLYLYDATEEQRYLTRAADSIKKAVSDFFDTENGGFFFSGKSNEKLIARPKETYDGAMPSGNSAMAYNLMRIISLCPDSGFEDITDKHFKYMSSQARSYSVGYGFFNYALIDYIKPK